MDVSLSSKLSAKKFYLLCSSVPYGISTSSYPSHRRSFVEVIDDGDDDATNEYVF